MRRALLVLVLLLVPVPPDPALASRPAPHSPTSLVAVISDGGSLVFHRLTGTSPLPRGKVVAVSSNPRVEVGTSPSEYPDPRSFEQWGLPAVGASASWGRSTGSGIVVAVIDTGVAVHEDLAGVLPGKDFVGDGKSGDPNGHGTHVAGIVSATFGNGKGVSGLAPSVSVLPVRVLDAAGSGDHASIASGIVWAVDNGADVLNLSLGGEESSDALLAAVRYAHAKGVVVVAAAGNNGASSNAAVYPAAYDEVIAVAATAPDSSVAMFSNTGPYVDLAAPGFAILSTLPDGYGYRSGTSQAAPFVAAAAAQLLATGASSESVRHLLYSSARDLGITGLDPASGHGLLDAAHALGLDRTAPPPLATPLPLPQLPAPTLPSLRPPSGLPSFAPTARLVVPGSVEYGARLEAKVMSIGCGGCVLEVAFPGSARLPVRISADGMLASVSHVLRSSGRVVLFADGAEIDAADVAVQPKVTISSASRRGRRATVRGSVNPSTRVSLQMLRSNQWSTVATASPSSGRFTLTASKAPAGLYRVVAGTSSSRPFPM